MPPRPYFAKDDTIYNLNGRLDPWKWCWEDAAVPEGAEPVSALAVFDILKSTGSFRKLPVGIIGPREATLEQLEAARAIGGELGRLGITMICGGKTGVMEAAAEGCFKAGGLTVGLVPDQSWRGANPYIDLPIATGLSEARNIVIARSCEVLIAVGGSSGTMTEIAFGLHFSKPVIGLCGAPHVDGLEPARDWSDAVARMAEHLLARAELS